MKPSVKLRKLQSAVDHVAAVLEDAPEAVAELSEVLDLIHAAESAIQEAADEGRS